MKLLLMLLHIRLGADSAHLYYLSGALLASELLDRLSQHWRILSVDGTW